jgi:hypothetical protein
MGRKVHGGWRVCVGWQISSVGSKCWLESTFSIGWKVCSGWKNVLVRMYVLVIGCMNWLESIHCFKSMCIGYRKHACLKIMCIGYRFMRWLKSMCRKSALVQK